MNWQNMELKRIGFRQNTKQCINFNWIWSIRFQIPLYYQISSNQISFHQQNSTSFILSTRCFCRHSEYAMSLFVAIVLSTVSSREGNIFRWWRHGTYNFGCDIIVVYLGKVHILWQRQFNIRRAMAEQYQPKWKWVV